MKQVAYAMPIKRLLVRGRRFARTRRGVLASVVAASLAIVVVAAFSVGGIGQADQPDGLWNVSDESLAILGYDPVAYFTDSQPIKGRAEFEHSWGDARWFFASEAHRAMFAADPGMYAPQYGGFCSAAMTYGQFATIDPEAWTIVDDRLYLNFDQYAHDVFRENLQTNIAKADGYWVEKVEAYRARAESET